MPPGRRSANPNQQLILKVVMVGFICLTILTLYRSCSKQRQDRIDALAADAKARTDAAYVDRLRIKRESELDANQTSITIEKLKNQAAAISERGRKESDALKELHRVIPENQPILLSGNYRSNNQAGIIMHLKNDDQVLLTRKPVDEDGKSVYVLQWSSGSTQLKEVVSPADNGLPQFSLVENLDNIKAHQIGWSDVRINLGINKFSGQYRYEYGVDGLSFDNSENSKYKVAVARAKEGYAGTKAGDALVEIAGVSVRDNTVEQIENKLTQLPGSHLAMRIFRSQPDPIDIKLVKATGGSFGTPCLGATKSDAQSNEAVVYYVQEHSNAANAGIHVGDVITEIDKSSVQGLSNKEVGDRLLGKVDEIKILHVSHFLDVELQYNQKDENTIKIEMPIVQKAAPASYSWSQSNSVNNYKSARRSFGKSPSASTDMMDDQARAEQLAKDYIAASNSNSKNSSVDFYAERVDSYGTVQTKQEAYADDAAYNIEYPYREFVFQSATATKENNGIFSVIIKSKFRRGLTSSSAGLLLDLTTRMNVNIGSNKAEIISVKNDEAIIAKYSMVVGSQDLSDSKGKNFSSLIAAGEPPVNALKEIIVQDRANFYRFGKKDAGDEPADWFANLGNADVNKRAAKMKIIGGIPISVDPPDWKVAPGTKIDIEMTPKLIKATVH